MMLFWELDQYRQIWEARDKAAKTARRASSVEGSIRRLEESIEKLILINMALWEFIREHHAMNEVALTEKVREIDLRDGKLDGRLTHTVEKCNNCGRTLNSSRSRCLYCGSENLQFNVFTSI